LFSKKNVNPEECKQSSDADAAFDAVSVADITERVGRGDVDLLGPYLRNRLAPLISALGHDDEAELLVQLGSSVDPRGTTEFRLKPRRRRRGRPVQKGSICRDAEIAREIESTRAGGKLEPAVMEVGERRNLSRSTMFAIRRRHIRPE
jgi:hypothetical protein